MIRTEKKEFNEIPLVKQFFETVKEEDATFKFQDVPTKSFEQAKMLLHLALGVLKLYLKSIQL